MGSAADFERLLDGKLRELTFNSKPIISALTMVAEDNPHYASVFCKAIGRRLGAVKPDDRLPLLYLVDSLVKNVKGKLFSALLEDDALRFFRDSFSRTGEAAMRQRLAKLLKTWIECKSFDAFKLKQLDEVVKQTPSLQPTQQKRRRKGASTSSGQPGGANRAPLLPQPVVSMVPRVPAYPMQQYGQMPPQPQPQDLSFLLRNVEAQVSQQRPDLFPALRSVKHKVATRHPDAQRELMSLQSALGPVPMPQQPQPQPGGQGYTDKLLHTLTQITSAIQPSNGRSKAPSQNTRPRGGPVPLATLLQRADKRRAPTVRSFGDVDLRARSPHFLSKLLAGQPCKTCGLRFVDKRKMAEHLDWHYRMNRVQIRRRSEVSSRTYYLPLDEWVELSDMYAPVIKPPAPTPAAPSAGTKRKLAGPAAAPVVRNVPVPPDADDQLACPVCGDQFEQFLDDDTDEWMYRGAVEVDGAILHQQCHEPPPLE